MRKPNLMLGRLLVVDASIGDANFRSNLEQVMANSESAPAVNFFNKVTARSYRYLPDYITCGSSQALRELHLEMALSIVEDLKVPNVVIVLFGCSKALIEMIEMFTQETLQFYVTSLSPDDGAGREDDSERKLARASRVGLTLLAVEDYDPVKIDLTQMSLSLYLDVEMDLGERALFWRLTPLFRELTSVECKSAYVKTRIDYDQN